MTFCQKYNMEMDSFLEVGMGFGTFSQEISEMNVFKRIVGIEPTPELAATCRGKGLETIEATIENAKFPLDKFNVIASFEVLEHIFCPKEFLSACQRYLSDKGLLVITCPSYQGFDIQLLGPISDSVDHEHLNYFSPSSLALLLNECGFETLEILTPGKLDAELVRKKVVEGKFSLNNHPFLKTVLLDEWQKIGTNFQQFLADNKLSSHMWAVARKR